MLGRRWRVALLALRSLVPVALCRLGLVRAGSGCGRRGMLSRLLGRSRLSRGSGVRCTVVHARWGLGCRWRVDGLVVSGRVPKRRRKA